MAHYLLTQVRKEGGEKRERGWEVIHFTYILSRSERRRRKKKEERTGRGSERWTAPLTPC